MADGAALLGVADLGLIGSSRGAFTDEDMAPFSRAVVAAVRLSGAVLDQIRDHPTKLYFHHYRMINALLDRIALRITNLIQGDGYQALPIPASQIVDWDTQIAHCSHKHAAEAAGLGWIGRSNLLVTPEYGSQVRLVTVLTDMPLEAGKPIENGCGQCLACIAPCPADAIAERVGDFNHMVCYEQLKEFQRKKYVGQFICGICVRACPGSRK